MSTAENAFLSDGSGAIPSAKDHTRIAAAETVTKGDDDAPRPGYQKTVHCQRASLEMHDAVASPIVP
jgi:hypothetical protein